MPPVMSRNTPGHRARKRFGQHFLVDPGVVHAILDAISPQENEHVVEIGPGHGALTDALAQSAGRLDLIELDRDLAAMLRHRFAGDDSVRVHEADALRTDFAALGDSGVRLRIVGNLPYNISTPLLFHLLDARGAIGDMHFMLQKEVVDRITAQPGSKAYGRLGIVLGVYFESESLFDVGPQSFDPPPAVTSAVVRLQPRPAREIGVDDPRQLSALLAAAFGKRRKTLRNALRDHPAGALLDACGIDPALRAEAVPPQAWVQLANRLAGQ